MENTEMMFWILWNSIKYGNYGIQILGNQKALWRQWPRDGFVRVQLSPDNCPPRHGGIIFPENSEFQKIWKIWTMELRFYGIWKISKIWKIVFGQKLKPRGQTNQLTSRIVLINDTKKTAATNT